MNHFGDPRPKPSPLSAGEWPGTGKFTDAMNLRPIYIRKPEAEEKLDGP